MECCGWFNIYIKREYLTFTKKTFGPVHVCFRHGGSVQMELTKRSVYSASELLYAFRFPSLQLSPLKQPRCWLYCQNETGHLCIPSIAWYKSLVLGFKNCQDGKHSGQNRVFFRGGGQQEHAVQKNLKSCASPSCVECAECHVECSETSLRCCSASFSVSVKFSHDKSTHGALTEQDKMTNAKKHVLGHSDTVSV